MDDERFTDLAEDAAGRFRAAFDVVEKAARNTPRGMSG